MSRHASRLLRALGVAVALLAPVAARADAVDDTLANFLADKFSQSEKAVNELAAEAPPQAAAILEALGDNRLMIDPADHIVAYKTAEGALINAKTGAPVSGAEPAAFKKVRVNNALRNAIQGAMGSLTLASSDPEKRLKAAQDLFNTRDAKALPGLEAQLAKESDSRVAAALEAGAGRDLRHQRQRLNPGSPLGDSNAEGARRSGRAEVSSTRSPRGRPIQRSKAPLNPP